MFVITSIIDDRKFYLTHNKFIWSTDYAQALRYNTPEDICLRYLQQVDQDARTFNYGMVAIQHLMTYKIEEVECESDRAEGDSSVEG